MKRRKFIGNTMGLGLGVLPGMKLLTHYRLRQHNEAITSGPTKPLTIYNNWSSYDELSDNIPLTEELAMKELAELIRLMKSGVHVDYYVMDAFWFDKAGGYRLWDKNHWPNGPGQWLSGCLQNGIKPGMWFSTNLIATHSGPMLNLIPEWRGSLATDPNILCMFEGGYLKHLAESLEIWYEKGVRAFKFDFAYFSAATPSAEKLHLATEIEELNKLVFMNMLKEFRFKNADILLLGYNGFGGDMNDSVTPFRKTVDPRWLEVFDTLYCGDPRISDVPAINLWRSEDIFSDHMVRQFEFNGLSLHRIDNCGFMIGTTGTCYRRAKNAWKGELILSLARGGWVNVYHGNLELLTTEDAQWFAKTQSIFRELQAYSIISTFGAIPGSGMPYGFCMQDVQGEVCTVVNPAQAMMEVELPLNVPIASKILYADGGYFPSLNGNRVILGPEQMAVIGLDKYADAKYELGVDDTIRIPISIREINTDFKTTGRNRIEGMVTQPPHGNLRIFMQQFGQDNLARRSWGGAPPDGKKMNELLKIEVKQRNRQIPTLIQYDKMIWCGLSWAAAEIDAVDYDDKKPLHIVCTSLENENLTLRAKVYETQLG